MIVVQLNKSEFEYDIHSLVKAFYPPENVCVCTEPKEFTQRVSLWLGVTFSYGQNDPGNENSSYYGTPEPCEESGDAPLADFGGAASSLPTQYDQELSAALPPDSKATPTITLELRQEPVDTGCEVRSGHKVFYEYAFDHWPVKSTQSFAVEPEDRKKTKNLLKQQLYHLLGEFTGHGLPWGTLTGIRPVKFALELLESGKQVDEVRDYMERTFYTPAEKSLLSIQIAKRELELLRMLDYDRGYSLYIGIPFCPSTCMYCSFTSYPVSAWRERVDAYLGALGREIDEMAKAMEGLTLNTVYIGGGTPTTLEPHQLEWLLTRVKRAFHISRMPTGHMESGGLLEFTVEAGRPDSITREKLAVLKAEGVSRISVNPQTMKQATLDLIGRHHRVEQVIDSYHMARELGFDNINMDLIMGLPEETLSDVEHTMEALRELAPDNITVHSLAVKRAARLNMFREDYAGLSIVNTQEHLDAAARVCREMGLEPYYLYRQKNMAGNFENVGYARPGKAGIYNVLIMEEKQTILALGAGAVTKFVYPEKNPQADYPMHIERVGNVKDAEHYIRRVDEMIERKKRVLDSLRNMEDREWH